jgi:hypothetical protein
LIASDLLHDQNLPFLHSPYDVFWSIAGIQHIIIGKMAGADVENYLRGAKLFYFRTRKLSTYR